MESVSSEKKANTYRLENKNSTWMILTDAGAAVVCLFFRGTDVVLGWDTAQEYFPNPGSFGATVGRSANRIGAAAFTLNGRRYELAKNDGENNLHSGPDGYHNRQWTAKEVTANRAVFCLDSPDGDQGYPGRLRVSVTYTLEDDDSVHIVYEGVSDADTVVNLTNHAYFNLNGHKAGTAMGHRLRINADAFTPVAPGLIPTGELRKVEGTPFDFRTAKPIGRDSGADDEQLRLGGGYDHNFALQGEGFRTAAELTGDKTGITLTVETDCPGVQLYTGNFLNGARGKGGAAYEKRSAVCLETQYFPNAVNEPGFASPVVKAGVPFRSETVWRLKKGKELLDNHD